MKSTLQVPLTSSAFRDPFELAFTDSAEGCELNKTRHTLCAGPSPGAQGMPQEKINV